VAVAVLALAALAAAGCSGDTRPGTLPPLGADITKTSVSGLSSGAYMAGQFQVAHASIVIAAGLVAGGPYGCAQSAAADTLPVWPVAVTYNVAQALNGCMADRLGAFGVLNPGPLARRAERLAAAGRIDPISDLRGDRVYLFSARGDETVAESVVKAAAAFYAAVGVPRENITLVTDRPGGHALLTLDAGAACGVSEPPYLNSCGEDQAGEILGALLGQLNPPVEANAVSFVIFDQGKFGATGRTGMDERGYAYIPSSCRENTGCAVHVVFHGCRQGVSEAGDVFVRQSGYARWAESNRLILLYPQVRPSTANPRGCWDWWGYTGRDYLTQDAVQIEAVRRMLAQLAAAPE
jgi:poly(3-hydroxybutyrate) depolymerase